MPLQEVPANRRAGFAERLRAGFSAGRDRAGAPAGKALRRGRPSGKAAARRRVPDDSGDRRRSRRYRGFRIVRRHGSSRNAAKCRAPASCRRSRAGIRAVRRSSGGDGSAAEHTPSTCCLPPSRCSSAAESTGSIGVCVSSSVFYTRRHSRSLATHAAASRAAVRSSTS